MPSRRRRRVVREPNSVRSVTLKAGREAAIGDGRIESPARSRLLRQPSGFEGRSRLVVGAKVCDPLLAHLDHVAPQVIKRDSAGRSSAVEPYERHLAIPRIENLL